MKSLRGRALTWIPAALLFAGILLWQVSADFDTIFPRAICAIAYLATIRAGCKSRYPQAAAWGGVAVLFNPFFPDMLSRIVFSGLYFLAASTAMVYLAVVSGQTRKPERFRR